MIHILIPHPDFPPATVTRVEAEIEGTATGRLALRYHVFGAAPALPARAAPARCDGLWKTTCFELFLRGEGPGYVEFNFSPSCEWAAYAFEAYRSGMRDLPVEVPPRIDGGEVGGTEYSLQTEIDLPWHADLASITAVIEETDGTRSFWALAHPPGKPDFHDPACFVLELPAATAV